MRKGVKLFPPQNCRYLIILMQIFQKLMKENITNLYCEMIFDIRIIGIIKAGKSLLLILFNKTSNQIASYINIKYYVFNTNLSVRYVLPFVKVQNFIINESKFT